MNKQILLTIQYDGTGYAGWQRQNNAVAVQEVLENAFQKLLERPVTLRAASRTDAGVHALGQRASFFSENLRIPLDKLPMVINGFLPADISVTRAEPVSDDFNPRFDAKRKTYCYNFLNAKHPNPLLSRYSAFVPLELNLSEMKKAAKSFVGKHDFAAFCATGGSAKTTVREIFDCLIDSRENGLITLTVSGGGFLYNMVRIIAGTVLYAGIGKLSAENIPMIIESKKRENAGKTMPPQGLVLVEVEY